jgi:RNA polymerase sigma-70 factor (ECF subfamily)
METHELVKACAAGDPNAWQLFVERHQSWIVAVARRCLPGAESEAPDVASEVLRQLLEKDRALLRGFRPPYNLRAWLAVLTRRAAARLLRKRRPVPAPPADAAAPEEADMPPVDSLLAELPLEDRLILRLYYGEGASYEEISRIVGVPVNTIGKRKFRALQALREIAGRKNIRFAPGTATPRGIH